MTRSAWRHVRRACGTANRRVPLLAAVVVIVCGSVCGWVPVAAAQDDADLSGAWVLDRSASQFPRFVGFDAPFAPVPDDGSDGRARGRRRGVDATQNSAQALRPRGESYDDGRRRERLTDEVRTPPSRLTIADSPEAVTITDEAGHSRTLRVSGRAETMRIDGIPVLTTVRRDGGKLIVLYTVADSRQLRYTYTRRSAPSRLEVDIEFLERGQGDMVHRVYAPPNTQAAPDRFADGSGPDTTGAPALPRAGSEFTGLTRIGIVVEELSSTAVSCGLKRDELEAAVSKPLTGAGVRVGRNGDEDTYLHVTIMTSTLPTGMCISRWDWSINSTTEATLSYQRSPLLAQVLLARKGGLSGSMPATHAADVLRGMADGVAQIATMIRDANK